MKSNSERDKVIICRCEEITLGGINEAIHAGATDVDAVKRMTRAGMGLCQGKTCGRLISGIIAGELGCHVSGVRQSTQRHPVRPVSAAVIAGAGTEAGKGC